MQLMLLIPVPVQLPQLRMCCIFNGSCIFIHEIPPVLPSRPTDLAMKCVMPNSGSDCQA